MKKFPLWPLTPLYASKQIHTSMRIAIINAHRVKLSLLMCSPLATAAVACCVLTRRLVALVLVGGKVVLTVVVTELTITRLLVGN